MSNRTRGFKKRAKTREGESERSQNSPRSSRIRGFKKRARNGKIQEKCREQQMPLYVAFIDLTTAFDLVSRRGLFRLLEKIGYPPKLLSIITSFHDNMKGTIQHGGSSSEPFPILSGVKQGCVLAPPLFAIFFSLLLSHAFKSSEEGIFLHTRSGGRLFNLARLRAKTKVRKVLIRELLFVDDAALTSHTEECLQRLRQDCGCLQRIWPNHQPQENEHHGTGRQKCSIHQYRRPHSGSGSRVHLPRLNYHQ
ncbi:uncharacterized protein [Heterodontus francisci]|uniref:uncharacterized protein n=1 Tax=Heterodontus francisci TaxID=7792 RepID=UPI00355BB1B2